MENHNSNGDQLDQFLNPHLVSEPSDFLNLKGEGRLRMLAKTIPSHGHHQLVSTTQGCISSTVHATQEFLSQVVSGLSLTNPSAATNIVVSSSGLNAINWLERTENENGGWLPNYPVSGYITFGLMPDAPRYGRSPFEPAITLCVNRSDDDCEDFLVRFSVADSEDMRLLAMLLSEAGDLWDKFEHVFGVSPSTSIPLPKAVESQIGERTRCREYASAFIEHIVAVADEDDCLETFELEFSTKQNTPLHEPIVAAIALLNAFSLYRYSVETMDLHKSRSEALKEIESAVETGRAAQNSKSARN